MSGRNGDLPAGLLPYRRTPIFDEATMPEGLRRGHSTKACIWGLIRVVEGRLRYRVLDPPSESILDPEHPGTVAPAQEHEVGPLGPVRFFVEFYRDAAAAAYPEAGPGEAGGDARHG